MKIDGFAVEKLGTGNDAAWLRDIKSLMVLKGVHGVLKTPPDAAHEEVAMALLSLSIAEHRKAEFLHCATAKDLYDHVESSYKSQNTARCIQLKKELHSLELGAEETIQAYVCRARTLQDMLSKAGVVLTEEEVVLAALSGLPEAYDAVVNNLESSTLEFSVAVPKLISAEQRLLRRRGTEHQAAAFTAGAHGPRCYACGKLGHIHRFASQGLGKPMRVLQV